MPLCRLHLNQALLVIAHLQHFPVQQMAPWVVVYMFVLYVKIPWVRLLVLTTGVNVSVKTEQLTALQAPPHTNVYFFIHSFSFSDLTS